MELAGVCVELASVRIGLADPRVELADVRMELADVRMRADERAWASRRVGQGSMRVRAAWGAHGT